MRSPISRQIHQQNKPTCNMRMHVHHLITSADSKQHLAARECHIITRCPTPPISDYFVSRTSTGMLRHMPVQRMLGWTMVFVI